MENITKYELLSYFSCEIFYFIGIFLNLFLFVFLKRKLNVKRVSDFITCSAVILSLLALMATGVNLFNFQEINLSLYNNLININNTSLILKIFINIYMLFFIFTTYKLTRKARFKTPLINSILLLITAFSNLLVQVENFILIYILFDLITVLIYKYASNMRIRKISYYSLDFISVGITASALFFGFYILTFFIKDSIQLNIAYVCLALAFFLKAGIFPFTNYLINKNYKTNLPYSILLFNFLPWISVLAFNNITKYINNSNEIYQITTIIFLTFTILYFGILTLKQKNLIKFLAKSNYCLTAFCMLNTLIISNNETSLKYSTLVAFSLLGIYSVLCILQINQKAEKINMALIKGLAFSNKLIALLFSILILMFTGIVPNGILKYNLQIINNIYSFDKLFFLTVFSTVLAFIFILLNSLKIIQNCYSFNLKKIKEKLTKKTALNYAVSVIIILFLISGMFL